ncbi:hypothetical protein ACWKWU_13520 [Chitinophaga lutea]
MNENTISLSQVLTQLRLLPASIEAQICMRCEWDDEDLAFYADRTAAIPDEQKELINQIISAELLQRFLSPPRIHSAPAEKGGVLITGL